MAVAVCLAIFFIEKSYQKPAVQATRANENFKNASTSTGAFAVATGLNIPWDIAFLENGSMLVTERTGQLILIASDGTKREIRVPNIRVRGEGGLLGIALHPDFATNRLLYLYMGAETAGGGSENRVVRYKFEENADAPKLIEDKAIISGIPGAIYHDGGRMEFGPDKLLYIATGDATDEKIAQDLGSLGGKILRLNEDGSIPSGNPFGTAVYSYGHRNPQGLAWDSAGRLWSTEHGRSGLRSGLDEINLIEAGSNYGWPVMQGNETRAGMLAPALHSGASDTWAPASAAIVGNSLFFGGLLGEALYEAALDGERVSELKAHFKGTYGRIRTVRVGPDGMLYLTTSNKDGRGSPASDDDKILRVDPRGL